MKKNSPFKIILYLLLSVGYLGFFESQAAPQPIPPPSDAIQPIPITPVSAPVPPPAPRPSRLWNLQGADIRAVIDAVAAETGKNFIVDPQVQGKITIVSSKPLTHDELYQVFLSALQVSGYSAVPSGNVIKIVPSTSARALSSFLATKTTPGIGDEPVSRIITVHNISAAQLIPILRPLLPESNTLSAYPLTNSLIVAGEASSVNRIAAIVNKLDQQGGTQSRIFALRFADADQMVKVLSTLQSSNQAAGISPSLAFAADKQTNSVVVRGTPDDLIRARSIISRLDYKQAVGRSNTQVIYLNYLKAKDVAPILTKIALGQPTTSEGPDGTTPGANGGAAGGDLLGVLSRRISIQAEPTANAIIMNAPPVILANLRSIIAKLDVQPQQVLVEAIIAQVDEQLLNQLGVLWGTVQASHNNTAVTSTGIPSTAGIPGFQLGIGIIRSGNFRAIITVLYNNNNANILSTPSVMVLNNQEAKIEVGKNVALENRIYGTTGTNVPNSDSLVPFTTLERKNVSLQLKVKPQISPNNTVNLAIEQINDTLPNPENPGTTPVINTSDIKTSVLVKSGDILVLGGLISHETADTVNKIPILGDIPLIGHAFRYDQKRIEKKNLIVFLRPVILGKNFAQSREISKKKYNDMRLIELRKQQGINLINSVHEAPLLPPFKDTTTPKKVSLPPPF